MILLGPKIVELGGTNLVTKLFTQKSNHLFMQQTCLVVDYLTKKFSARKRTAQVFQIFNVLHIRNHNKKSLKVKQATRNT